jgi:hypothetical protein
MMLGSGAIRKINGTQINISHLKKNDGILKAYLQELAKAHLGKWKPAHGRKSYIFIIQA